ncbi:Cyanogenic beta-glucosidase, partial [Bienertia sinuspersici]
MYLKLYPLLPTQLISNLVSTYFSVCRDYLHKRFQFANRYMYPRSMQSLVKGRLPKLSAKQLRLVNGSFDFLGLDYYIAYYASYSPVLNLAKPSYDTDAIVKQTAKRNEILIGPEDQRYLKAGGSDLLYVYPRGIRYLLLYVKRKFNNPMIYITENGEQQFFDSKKSIHLIKGRIPGTVPDEQYRGYC